MPFSSLSIYPTHNCAKQRIQGTNFTTTLFFAASTPSTSEPYTLNTVPSFVSIPTSCTYQIRNTTMSCTPPVPAAENATSGNGTPNSSAPRKLCYQPSASPLVRSVEPDADNVFLLAFVFLIHILAPYPCLDTVVLTADSVNRTRSA